jgi:hypothetical protein
MKMQKVKLSAHAIKVYSDCGGITSLILNLDSKRR